MQLNGHIEARIEHIGDWQWGFELEYRMADYKNCYYCKLLGILMEPGCILGMALNLIFELRTGPMFCKAFMI